MNIPQINVDLASTPQDQAKRIPDEYLISALEFLRNRVTACLAVYFQKEEPPVMRLPLPEMQDESSLARFTRDHCPSEAEMIILLTALVPHVLPGFFDKIILGFLQQGGELPEFGGIKGEYHRGTIPTGETALFILAGMDVKKRVKCLELFGKESFLFKSNIISIGTVQNGEPAMSGRLVIEPEFAEVFTTGKIDHPRLSIHFPAQHITTQMNWADLVLNKRIREQVAELETWIGHHYTLLSEWKMASKLKPGYRVLFYGPPGTGKTLTATLLGKYTGREVFRIDLSMVVSKFIGETEKNLASLFDKAEHKNWILFFDEADAIFGKRTGVRDAHDKYANQEVSYLLQRIEAHPGLVILASNFRNNIDEAFIRRFSSIVYFPPPSEKERLRLWQQSFPAALKFESDVNLEEIAAGYELTGAHIINIVQHVCLSSLEKGVHRVSHEDILLGVRREMEKEGK